MSKIQSSLFLLMWVGVTFLLLLTPSSGAWFVTSQSSTSIVNNTANVMFIVTGDVIDFSQTPYVPGEELLETPIQMYNLSTIATEVRIKIEYDIILPDELEITKMTYQVPDTYFQAIFQSGWSYNSTDHYFYSTLIEPNQTLTSVITSMSYNALTITNPNMGETLGIYIRFEAKQFYFVDWEDIGVIGL